MTRITYGVVGLIDWSTTVPTEHASIRIHFTGGGVTKYGITPAEFATTNPALQRIIEQSPQFKSGRIVKLSTAKL